MRIITIRAFSPSLLRVVRHYDNKDATAVFVTAKRVKAQHHRHHALTASRTSTNYAVTSLLQAPSKPVSIWYCMRD